MVEKNAVVRGRGVAPGLSEGPALISKRPFMFPHGVEPKTGDVVDVRSDLLGKNIRGKVLMFPFGKGSTTGSSWFLEAVRQGNGPSAIINGETEVVIATGVAIARLLYGVAIPLVDRLEEEIADRVKEGTIIQVNGDKGEVTIIS